MQSIINIILLVCAVYIFFEIVLAFLSYRNREKIITFLKNKKVWGITGVLIVIISIVPVTIISVYAFFTPILILIRGNCFLAQHVYIGNHHFISYNNEAYVEFTDDEEIDKMYNEVVGDWKGGSGYVIRGSVSFPYLEYWIPDKMLEDFEVSSNGEYMITDKKGVSYFYRRFVE